MPAAGRMTTGDAAAMGFSVVLACDWPPLSSGVAACARELGSSPKSPQTFLLLCCFACQ